MLSITIDCSVIHPSQVAEKMFFSFATHTESFSEWKKKKKFYSEGPKEISFAREEKMI
jgi:hypothetical protein